MKTRIYNARILTMQENTPIFCGEVQISDGKITYIGPEKPNDICWDREIDAGNNLLMPGFKNAHTHSPMTFLRSYADDVPLHEWLYEKIFPMEAKLTDEDIYWCSILANMEYVTSGITANFDMYIHPLPKVKASIDTGFRTAVCGHINDFCSSLEEMEEQYIAFNKCHPLLSCQLGFHAEYTTNRKLLEGVAALAQKYKAPVYAHMAETKREVEECIGRYQKTPIAFLDEIGMFNYGGGGFHCVHVNDEDLAICRERGIHVITNPSSNLKLASGIAPIQKMVSMGIGVGIGTDGPASNNCLDMFREMFLVTALQKVLLEDASAMDAREVLKMATVGGARAMGLYDSDVLAVGKNADMILIDMSQPNMQPEHQIEKNLVYSGSKQNVLMTMVAGKVLYERGEFFMGVSKEEVYARVNEGMLRMLQE